jgi:transposase
VTNKRRSTLVTSDPTEICEALVGLKDIQVLEYRRTSAIAELVIEQVVENVRCPTCNAVAHVKDRPIVTYVDLPVFGAPFRLVWHKHRMRCPNASCETKSWVLTDHRIAAKDCFLTTRAAKWATKQVGAEGRTVRSVAKELQCDWEVVDRAVVTYGQALLGADTKRLKQTKALGLDETQFCKIGEYKRKQWCTTVADVGNHQLIDMLPSRDYVDVARWIDDRPQSWKDNIEYGALDMSNTYAAVYTVTLPNARQVVDPFHCMQLANRNLDAVRRRVQAEQLRPGEKRSTSPLYRIRKLLVMKLSNLGKEAVERLEALLDLGDPTGEVAVAHQAKEALKSFYEAAGYDAAREQLHLLRTQCGLESMPPELQSFAKTLEKWFDKIAEWHNAHVSNGPTEGLNNLIKRVKRIGFGFRNFESYRIRCLLYAGKPNWRVLDSIVVT